MFVVVAVDVREVVTVAELVLVATVDLVGRPLDVEDGDAVGVRLPVVVLLTEGDDDVELVGVREDSADKVFEGVLVDDTDADFDADDDLDADVDLDADDVAETDAVDKEEKDAETVGETDAVEDTVVETVDENVDLTLFVSVGEPVAE